MTLDERACRRKAREAEWNFRVLQGLPLKDTFWNHLPLPSHRPGLIRRKGAFMDFFFDNLEGRLNSTLPHYDRPDGTSRIAANGPVTPSGTSASPRAM